LLGPQHVGAVKRAFLGTNSNRMPLPQTPISLVMPPCRHAMVRATHDSSLSSSCPRALPLDTGYCLSVARSSCCPPGKLSLILCPDLRVVHVRLNYPFSTRSYYDRAIATYSGPVRRIIRPSRSLRWHCVSLWEARLLAETATPCSVSTPVTSSYSSQPIYSSTLLTLTSDIYGAVRRKIQRMIVLAGRASYDMSSRFVGNHWLFSSTYAIHFQRASQYSH